MSLNPTEYTKVYLSTTGCVEAQLSTKCIEKYFEKKNFSITRDVGEADYIIFYACGLTGQSEKKSLQAINNLKIRMSKTAKLVVWGCLTKQNPEALWALCDGHTVGPLGILFKENLEATEIPLEGIPVASPAEGLISTRETSKQVYEEPLDSLTNAIFLAKQGYHRLGDKVHKRTRPYYIRTAIGCNGSCTYCSERPVFGRVKSRPVEDVVNEFKQGLQQGYNRFSLLATDLGAYGMDFGSNLGDLLRKMIETKTEVDYKLILNQVEPNNLNMIYPDLEEILASGKVEELMCPVQSGNNRILKLMGRNYTIEDWKSSMLKINTKFPKVRLNTHLMVGFPTETEEDFNETKKLLDPPPFFDDITVFKYSSRPVVPSQHIPDQVSEKTKESRYKELLRKYARMYAFNFMR
jgi:tRNA A37 methylthiotransferase MiaB